jgi:hypothetical protein
MMGFRPPSRASTHPTTQILDRAPALPYERAMLSLRLMQGSSAIRRRAAGPGALRMR